MRNAVLALLASIFTISPSFAAGGLAEEIDRRAAEIEPQVIAWRRDIHQHPELSNREVRTAKLVADHLEALGIEARTGIAHTGVVGLLRGGRPGGVVARVRADMDWTESETTEEIYDPESQVARSEQRSTEESSEASLGAGGIPGVASNAPDAAGAAAATSETFSSNSISCPLLSNS